MALFLAIKLPAIITSSHCLLQSCCPTTRNVQPVLWNVSCLFSFFLPGSLSPLVSCGSLLGFDITCRAPSAASLLTQCLVFGTRKAQIRGNSAKAGTPVKSPTTPTASEAPAPAAASLHRTAVADHYPSSSSSSAPRVTLPESLSIAKSIDAVVPTPLDIPQPLPLWLNTACAKHIVKGNFMTLSARPKTVDHGEWVAHQGK